MAGVLASFPGRAAAQEDAPRRSRSAAPSVLEGAPLAPAQPGTPALALPRGTGDYYEIESGPVDFGRMLPGEPRELPAAIRVRVHASRDWVLGIVPDSPLKLLGGGGSSIPHSRISWRTRATGTFVPLAGGRSELVARGDATGPRGQLVLIDLSLKLDDEDEIGVYGCDFRFVLEPL